MARSASILVNETDRFALRAIEAGRNAEHEIPRLAEAAAFTIREIGIRESGSVTICT
jgi:hypothetical protein